MNQYPPSPTETHTVVGHPPTDTAYTGAPLDAALFWMIGVFVVVGVIALLSAAWRRSR